MAEAFQSWQQSMVDNHAQLLSDSFRENVNRRIATLMPKCQSPIEKTMLVALVCDLMMYEFQDGIHLICPDIIEEVERAASIDFDLAGFHAFAVQVPIGKYTADFVVRRVERVAGRSVATPIVVVECDGHDFHERTKEQARHDRSRDRAMLADGYHVVRFTGTEIHRAAWRCSHEVSTLLKGMIDRAKPKTAEDGAGE